MGDERAAEQIHYLLPAPSSRRERVVLVLYPTFIVGRVIAAVFYHSAVAVLYAVTGMIALSYQLVKLRRGIRADARGLHRPLLPVLPWDQVRAIVEPSQLRPELVLWCTDGTRRGTMLPMEYADELSRVSGKPIQTEKAMQRPLPKVEMRKTWQQEQDDFAARSARVKARNAELLGDTETPRASGG